MPFGITEAAAAEFFIYRLLQGLMLMDAQRRQNRLHHAADQIVV
jgi:hypothetical protein